MTAPENGHASNGDVAAQEREVQKAYWSEHSATPTVETMMLDSHAAQIDQLERPEVMSLLGEVKGKDIIELGAGIGRFTGELATRGAASVVAVDFMETSIRENERINSHFGPHMHFQQADVCELQLPEASADIVFSNWLLMYLSDAEVESLAVRMLSWLRPGGAVFFRESCFRQSGDKARKSNPTHYRNPREYFRIFDNATRLVSGGAERERLELQFCKCVDTYVQVKRNQNQICWRWVKVAEDAVPQSPASPSGQPNLHQHPEVPGASLRHFLDARQYSTDNILRYEAVYGHGFTSPGGPDSAKELSAMLQLKGGERVLDVGCGVGGSTYHISETYNCHVHGLDLSVNCILLALERTSTRPGADVTFEVADCTTRDFAPGSFDVVYSRDVLLHVEAKEVLFKNIMSWLRPGGLLLFTDYCAATASGEGSSTSQGMKSYLAQRRYSLTSLEHYQALLTGAGFVDVSAQDRTQQFVGCLQGELARLEGGKEAFVATFGQQQYDDYKASWTAKMARAQAGEQRWGLFMARKAAAAN